MPLKLQYAHIRLADASQRAVILARLTTACAAFGTHVTEDHGRLVIGPGSDPRHDRH